MAEMKKPNKGHPTKRRPNVQGKSTRFDKEAKETKFPKKDCANDPSWYLVNGQLAKDVASFSFNNALGDPIVRNPMDYANRGLVANRNTVPGIAAITVGPTVGVSNWENSAVNLAAKDIYSFVRHANSGHSNYDPSDLMLYLMAADSVQMYWSYMVRAYGVMRTFSQINRYVGDGLLAAMGIDASDLRTNIAQFRAYVNDYAIRASVLAVPSTMTLFKRHSWMFQNIYLDEDVSKAQMYMYVPAYLYKYAIDPGTSAGKLSIEPIAHTIVSQGYFRDLLTARTFAQLKTIGDNLINAMLSQEDVGIMSGDILKAYSSDSLYRFAQLDENYAIAPIYSEEVLAQIHNTNFLGTAPLYYGGSDWLADAEKALEVTQDTTIGSGILMWEPGWLSNQRNCYDQIIDYWKESPDPETVLVASRNKVMCSTAAGNVVNKTGQIVDLIPCRLQTCGSEIPITMVVFQYDPLTRTLSQTYAYGLNTTVNQAVIPQINKFNEHPILDSWSGIDLSQPYGEMSNYTILNFADINFMHSTALLSMFGVPYKW